MQYGFHPVFILAAMLDPKLYPHLDTIPMDERIQAEELVMQLYGTSRSFGNAAVGQLKNYREGNHGLPEYALENVALTSDGVGFWRDYGRDNPALRHLYKVAERVLGIPPTAAGALQRMAMPRTSFSRQLHVHRLLRGLPLTTLMALCRW